MIGTRLGLPWITTSTNPSYGTGEREFHPDWFSPTMPQHDGPIHALILDDTWTTGARAQSLAHALKNVGATTVSTIVLGRHIDPDYAPSQRLRAAITDTMFDISRCAAEDDQIE